MKPFKVVEIVIVLLATFHVSLTLAQDEVPEVWPVVRPDLKYRKLYQFQMNDDTKDRLMIEEWGSIEDQLYRLDLISSESRISYLSNGKTNEVWRYKPFVCDKLEPNSKELSILANLFQGWPTAGGGVGFVYGLGPLWLRASSGPRDKIKVDRITSGLRVKKDMIRYEVKMSSPTEPNTEYNLKFYFNSEKLEDLESVIWTQSSDERSVPDVPGGWKSHKVAARVKLVSIDLKHLDDSVFQLPLGYGCQRQEALPHQLSLKLLEPGTTQQASLEVVLSRNLGDSHLTNSKWDSKRHSIRLLRGSFNLNGLSRSYYVAVDQSRDFGTFKLRRRKRVWSAQEGAKEARVYTIDEIGGGTGGCKVEHMSLNDIIRMSFPSGLQALGGNTDNNNDDHDQDDQSAVSLGLNLIHWLFEDVEGYHLVREQSEHLADLGTLKLTLYEKRIKQMQLNGLWTGPASIVKKISHLKMSNQLEELENGNPLHISISVFFYSDDMTRILDKVVINLVENDLVDVNYLHKLMDVSECFESNHRKDPVIIKYPLESQQVVDALSDYQEPMRELLLSNLFQTTPIEPLQVSNVELTFDHFYMHLKFDLLDLPLTEIFQLQMGLELTLSKEAKTKEDFLEKIAGNVEKCATSCAHYNCLRFSYNSNNLDCRLELAENTADFQASSHGHLYSSLGPRLPESSAWSQLLGGLNNKPYLAPGLLYSALKELVKLDANSPWDSVPLVVRLRRSLLLQAAGAQPSSSSSDDEDLLLLKPSSVHSELDSVGDIGSANLIGRQSELSIEYSVLVEGFEFKRGKAFERLEEVSQYETCAQACEATDCRSFSYCDSKQTCSLTNLHSSVASIVEASDERAGCKVFSMDYLSKFEDLGPVKATARVNKVVEGGMRAADCASACIKEAGFACQGFYHCKDNTCLLRDRHVHEEDSKWILALAEEHVNQKCRLYSRSYLNHFNDYYDKALKEVKGQPELVGYGAEACAKICIRDSCLAFHVCHDADRPARFTCRLAQGKELKRDQVESRRHCTTFVLSDRSQYNLFKQRANMREPDKEAAVVVSTESASVVVDEPQEEAKERDINAALVDDDASSQQHSKLYQSAPFRAKLFSLAYGLLLGACLGLVWKKQDFLYSYTTRAISQFRGR